MRMPDSLVARGAMYAGAVHALGFALFASVVLYLASVPVAQWQLTWLYLEPIDWPASQLIWWKGWPRDHITWLPYQLSDPFWFFIPCLVFGVVGTLWYSLLGGIMGGVVDAIRARRRQVTLIVVPGVEAGVSVLQNNETVLGGTTEGFPMSIQRVRATFRPRDATDVALIACHGLVIVTLLVAPVMLVFGCLRWLGVSELPSQLAVCVLYLLWSGIILSAIVWRLELHPDGLRFVRLLGSPRFLAWGAISEVAPASRREVFLKGWLWPPWPPREASTSMTTLGHYRIVADGRVRYFPPADAARFVTDLRAHGVNVVS